MTETMKALRYVTEVVAQHNGDRIDVKFLQEITLRYVADIVAQRNGIEPVINCSTSLQDTLQILQQRMMLIKSMTNILKSLVLTKI